MVTIRPHECRDAVRGADTLDRTIPDRVLSGCRRHFCSPGAVDYFTHDGRGGGRVACCSGPGGSVFRSVLDHGRPDDRGLLRARRDFVLPFLGGHANPDVLDYRGLGWSESGLCGNKIFPVHAAWVFVDVGSPALFESGCWGIV